MIRIDKVRYGLKYAEIWFPEPNWKSIKSDLIRLHCLPSALDSIKIDVEMQHTRWTDLTMDENELRNAITSKTYRYDIRRSFSDNIEIKRFGSNELNEELLQSFAKCYHKMYAEKGMDVSLDTRAVWNCAQNEGFALSVVYLNNEPIVFHSYLCDKEIVVLWHSCSTFRNEKEIASIIARANKRLHWEDWMHFRQLGVKIYDWGGVFAFDSDNGIDQFKAAFGGCPHDYYHTAPFANSFIGKLALMVYKILPRKMRI